MTSAYSQGSTYRATAVHNRQQDKVTAFTRFSTDSDLGEEVRQRLAILEEETGLAD